MHCRLVKVALLLAIFGVVASARAQEMEAARGSELLKPFKQELQQALRSSLAVGPDNAIEVCKDQAPMIAARLSVAGVALGRSSHKLRNPENEPPAWVTPLMQQYLQEQADLKPAVVALPEQRVGYVEPIVMQPLCLTCHGDELAPGIAERITAAYPEDAATGFKVGDVRGVFWVAFPAD